MGDKILGTLESLLGGWVFICVDARSGSRGLITGWNSRSFYYSNSWSIDSGLGLELHS